MSQNMMQTIRDRFMPKLTPENSYGLVLSGGGTRGSYEVGVWKALKEMKIPIGGIAGTSIGAINGALFLTNDIPTIEDLYQKIQMDDIVELNEAVNREKNLMSFENIRAMMGTFIAERGLSNQALRDLIEKYIDVRKLAASPVLYGLVTTDIVTMASVEIFKGDVPEEKLLEYILSSANYPFFKPVESEDKKLIDGGLRDNMPINLLIGKGFKKIIVVDIDGVGRLPAVADPSVYLKRISFTEDLGGVFEFSQELTIRNMKMGYYDTLKAFRRIYGYFYYFSKSYFHSLMQRFDLDTIHGIETAAKLYKIPRYQLITDDSFLIDVARKHEEMTAQFQATKSTSLLAALIHDFQKVTEMIDHGIIIAWVEEQLNSQARFQRSWLTDILSEYISAARGMTELSEALRTKR